MQARINGTLVHPLPPQPPPEPPEATDLGGYIVTLYELATEQPFASTRSAPNGEFVLLAEVVEVAAIFGFRVTRPDSGEIVGDTGSRITWSLGGGQPGPPNQPPLPTGPIEIPIPDRAFVIYGYVRTATGAPVSCIVHLIAFGMNGETGSIANTTTSADGRYEVGPMQPGAMVAVRAVSGENQLLAESPARFDPGRVDLVLDGADFRGRAELDEVVAAVDPLREQVAYDEITAEQIAFLAAHTGISPDVLATFARAARLASSPGSLQPPQANLQLDFVYALLRIGHPETLPEFIAERPRFTASLDRAVAQNIVTARSFALDLVAVDGLLQVRAADVPGFAGARAASSPTLSQQDVAALASAYVTHAGTPADYWATVRTNGVAESVITNAQEALRLEVVADGHAPLVTHLLDNHGDWTTVADLAAKTDADWLAIVTALSSLPPGLSGTLPEQRAAYAKIVSGIVRRAYPTRAVVEHLKQGDPSFTALAGFAASTPAYEMGSSTIRKHSNDAALIAKAEPVERMFRIAGPVARSENVAALGAAGYDSALAVVRSGRAGFLAAMASLATPPSPTVADEMFSRATQQHAIATSLIFRYAPALGGGGAGGGSSGVLGSPKIDPTLPGLPDWEALFSGVDFCSCEECQSVLSPAAYLVDLLQFLKLRPAAPGSASALSVLDTAARRSDILDILFTCENTNTALPYIDLVNEILERVVDPPAPGSPSPQTTLPADELAAHPEHLRQGAYEILANAAFPFALPYDLWLDEARSYLGMIGLTRAEIRAGLLDSASGSPATDDVLAHERLGLHPSDVILLTGAASDASTAKTLWGLAPADPAASSVLSSLENLLSRAELTYETAVEVLTSKHVGGSDAMIVFAGASCDLGTATVTWPADGAAAAAMIGRLAKFERLRRRAALAVHDTDRAIEVFGIGTAASAGPALAELARIRYVAQTLGVPFAEALTWRGTLDTFVEPTGRSQYERVFVDPARPTTHPLRLNAGRTDLESVTQSLEPGVPGSVLKEVAAALGLSSARVSALVSEPPWQPSHAYAVNDVVSNAGNIYRCTAAGTSAASGGPTGTGSSIVDGAGTLRWAFVRQVSAFAIALGSTSKANLANLSTMYRYVSFARALGIDVEELTVYATLLEIDPFASGSNVERVFHAVRADQALGFATEDVGHALLGVPSTLDMVDQDVTSALIALRDMLAKIADAYPRVASSVASWPAWQPSHPYVVNDVVTNGGNVYRCTVAGTSAAAGGPTGAGADIVDGADGLRWNFVRTAGYSAFDPIPDADGALTLKLLRAVFADAPLFAADTAVANDVYAFVTRDPSRAFTLAEQLDFIATKFQVFMPDAFDREVARVRLASDPAAPPGGGYLVDRVDRLAFVLPHIIAARVRAARRPALAGLLAAQTGISVAAASLLLRDPLIEPPNRILLHEAVDGSTRAALDTLLGLGAGSSFTAAEKNTYRRISKIAFIVRRLRLSATELEYVSYLIKLLGPPGSRELDEVPIVPAKRLPYTTWLTLRELVALRDAGASTLFEFLNNAYSATGTGLQELSERTGWPLADLTYVAAATSPPLIYPASYAAGTGVLVLARAMRVITKAGLSAQEVWSWRELWPIDPPGSPDPRAVQANAIKDAARARLGLAEYRAAGKVVRDGIRERQRDALVAHLRAKNAPSTLRDKDELSGRYLVDVEQAACAMTSRVKNALSSIQTFVQRAMLGLETIALGMDRDLEFSSTDLAPWSWMKNHRVWEANRKVFLWPENWIEPELRDQQTPLFKQFEREVLKNELTDENVEKAYLGYLHKLNEVAQLQVCTTCLQTKVDGSETLHVFARTPNVPHHYFWRQRTGGAWTPWQKLDLDIEGDHLYAVFHDRRIYLFWLVIVEKPRSTEKDMGEYTELRLVWSVYFAGEWSKKQLSRDSLPPPYVEELNLFNVPDPLDYPAPYRNKPNSFYTLIAGVLPDGDLVIAPFKRLTEAV